MKNKNQRIATLLSLALIPLSGFATDMYIPSLPSMARDLHANSIQVQLTLSLFLISYGVSQLFVGSFLDSFGRYKASLYALIIFSISCVIIAATHNIYVIYLMRIVHGITIGTVVVAKRAYFVDVFKGEKLKHYLSLFTIIWSAGPIVAPFIGGYLQTTMGWASNFYVLAGLAIVFVVLEFIYGSETLQHPTEFHIERIVKIYRDMLSTTSFTLGIGMLGLAYCM
ncbi:MAG: MFS transporter, partial [Daejeonella sp.]